MLNKAAYRQLKKPRQIVFPECKHDGFTPVIQNVNVSSTRFIDLIKYQIQY